MPPPPEVAKGERQPLPTGTVTFLFSDIEGSTQRWETRRDAMRVAVAKHEQLMRSAIEDHNGYIFKTLGDAFCATFRTAPDAVNAAIAAQRALAAEDFSGVDGLQVRVGIHTGHADEREGDYFGPAVNRVARLMSIGHGGQILLSGATHALLTSDLPAEAVMVDLGMHRLRDLTNPEQVWQLTIGGTPQQFPPLRSLDALPHNLPIQHTSFRGRERDVEEVKKLLREHHLVTLVGPGGIGKTRLGLQAAAEILDDFSDGVWLIDLASITDPEIAASDVAKVLGVVQSEEHTVDEAVVHWLKRKRLLLILDNCEHLLEAVTRLAHGILRTCPQVRILTTSRQALGIPGEFVYRLFSLEMPELLPGLIAEDALRFGAIALFVDRAVASDTRFKLTDDNVPGVADICRRLDGIPLAIELAAARVKVLSIPNLAQRLNERFKILTTGSRTAVPRQKTLSALIDWSYDLLSSQEKLLFDRLAIFAGGFGYDAVAAVCTGNGIDELELLDLLASLTDKSLIVAETSGQEERYRLLESTRAYALEKLTASGEYQNLARCHAEYYESMARAAEREVGMTSAMLRVARLEREADNFRAALEWTIKQGNDVELGATLAGELGVLWSDGGLTAEGRWWIGAAVERLDEKTSPKAAAIAWRTRAQLSAGQKRYEAADHARALYEATDDPLGLAITLHILGSGCMQTGRTQLGAQVGAQESRLFRALGNKGLLASSLNQEAILAWLLGNLTVARQHFDEALVLVRSVEDEILAARVKGNSAEFEFALGNTEKALINVLEAITVYARCKNYDSLTTYNNNMAAYRIALGDLDAAYSALIEGMRWAKEAQSEFDIAVSCQHLALVAALHGRVQDAARILGFVNGRYRDLGLEREYTEKWSFEKLQNILVSALSQADIDLLLAEGAKLSQERATEEALAIAKVEPATV